MVSVQSLLDQIPAAPELPTVAAAPTLSQNKQAEVAAAVDTKKAELGGPAVPDLSGLDPRQLAVGWGTGKGAGSMSPVEADLRQLSPQAFDSKYGAEGAALRHRVLEADRGVYRDSTASRDATQVLWDGLTGIVGTGAVQLAGVVPPFLGMVSPEAGTALSQGLDTAQRFINEHQSAPLNQARQIGEVKSALTSRDNTARFEQDTLTDGPLLASMKRVGRDIVSEAGNLAESPMTTYQSGVDAVGSLVAGGVFTKGLKLAGAAATLGRLSAPDAGVVAQRIAKAADWLAWPAATAGMEGGGAYQSTVSAVMNTPAAELEKTSAPFRDAKAALLAQGLSEEDAVAKARAQVANSAGLEAAAIQAPAAAVTSLLARSAGEHPLHRVGPVTLAKEAAGEFTEELAQSGSGRFAQNVGVQAQANPEQSLSEGVGGEAIQGALAGAMSVGVTKGPGAAATAGVDAARAGIGLGVQGVGAVLAAGDRKIARDTDAVSPVADTKVQTRAAELADAAPTVMAEATKAIDEAPAAPETKDAGKAYLASLVQTLATPPGEQELAGLPEAFRQALAPAKDRFDAVLAMARMTGLAQDPLEQLQAASVLHGLLGSVQQLKDADPGVLAELPPDHRIKDYLGEFEGLAADIEKSPSIAGALKQVRSLIDSGKADQALPVVDQAMLADPAKTQQVVNATLMVASEDPTKLGAAKLEAIQAHADQGRLALTADQRRVLDVGLGVLRAKQEWARTVEAQGLTKAADVVTKQIFTNDDVLNSGPGEKVSALQYARSVMQAVRAGNPALAAERLTDLGLFVEHMKNKVQALDEHYTTDDPAVKNVPYMALVPNQRKWMLSTKNTGAKHPYVFVNTRNEASIRMAQTIEAEQVALAQVYNALVQAFPDLGPTTIALLSLPDALHGKAADIVKAHAGGKVTGKPSNEVAVPDEAPKAEPGTKTGPAAPVEHPALDRPAPPVDPERGSEAPAVVADQPGGPVDAVVAKGGAEAKQEAPPAERQPGMKDQLTARQEAERLAEPVTSNKPLGELFPTLLRRRENMLDRAFKPATSGDQAPTRIMAQGETPLALVRQALRSSDALTAFVGRASRLPLAPETAKQYAGLIGPDGALAAVLERMNANLATFLAEPYSKTRTIGEALLGDLPDTATAPNRWGRGKALNILDEVDGELAYNEHLQQAAGLAAMQWWLTANNYVQELDEDAIQRITGLDGDDARNQLSQDELDELGRSMSADDAVGRMAGLITKFWGLKAGANADLAYAEGIPQAVAAELLRAMVAAGMVQVSNLRTTAGTGETLSNGKAVQDFNRYSIKPFDRDEPLMLHPTAIQEAVLVDPDPVVYLHDELPKVADRQMNNPDVANTPEQKQALENEQKTPFHFNMVMLKVYEALGDNGIKTLFGGGADLETRALNARHRSSLEGKNRAAIAAANSLWQLGRQVSAKAEQLTRETGIERLADTVAIRYAYNFSRVGRMQMIGAYNPQSNKLVREAVLPTWSTLDLSDKGGVPYQAFALALAQALGIKVHKQGLAQSMAAVEALLDGPLAPAVQMLADVAEDRLPSLNADRLAEVFMTAKAGKVTPLALHALSEYARYRQADAGERKAFRTGLYVEADGVTNGPINAMMLMSTGAFTPDGIANIAKGGVSVGPARSLADLGIAEDLYATASNTGLGFLRDLRRLFHGKYAGQGLDAQMDQLHKLMTLVGMKGIDYDPARPADSRLLLNRDIAKNPLTITIYGSSARGIANNLAGSLVDALYEKMSEAAGRLERDTGLSLAQALNPVNPVQGQALLDALSDLTERKVSFNPRDGSFSLVNAVDPQLILDPVTFEIGKDAFRTLQENMLHLFVQPMRDGITEVVGEPLMKAVTKLRQATQAQSVVLEHFYQREIETKLAERKAKDPGYKPGDFLSKADLARIMEKLAGVSPLVHGAGQALLIAKSQRLTSDKRKFARALDDSIRTSAQVHAPANAGVGGIPFTTIGFGDGVMMLNLARDATIEGTLKIFDGMNMPLDKLAEYGRKANQAVQQSWQNNPLRFVEDSYARFLQNKDDVRQALEQEAREVAAHNAKQTRKAEMREPVFFQALARSVFEQTPQGITIDAVVAQLDTLGRNLAWASNQAEARHRALADVPLSIDQMAATATPYSTDTAGNAPLLTDEQAARLLNERREHHLDQLRQKGAVPTPAMENKPAVPDRPVGEATSAAGSMAGIGRLDRSGARVISQTALKKLVKRLPMTKAQAAVLGEILRSTAARDYTVVFGSASQLSAYQDRRGLFGLDLTGGDGARVHGYVNHDERTIYLIDPTAETLVHELVHAATYQITLEHYRGGDVGEHKTAVADAVARLEGMMESFLAEVLDPATSSPALLDAAERAKAQIESDRRNLSLDPAVAKAKALNEYLAWSLSNPQLADAAAKTTVAGVVRAVLKAIKQMIWGRKTAPALADDGLATLQFNAGILARAQAGLASQIREGTQRHASMGSSDRLSGLREALASKVADLLDLAPEGPDLNLQNVLARTPDMVVEVTDQFAAHFPMGAAERATFQMVVLALATAADLNPAILSRLQEIYAHVTKTLSEKDFMPENPVDPDVERHYAVEKYNLILGKNFHGMDEHGRSTLLPSFLGLAMVSDEFRAVLASMAPPVRGRNQDGTLDARLDNVGNALLDQLSRQLAGEGKTRTVVLAMDQLADALRRSVLEERSLLDEIGTKAQGYSDRANAVIANGLDTLAEKTALVNRKVQATAAPAAVKAIANIVETLTKFTSKKSGDLAAAAVMDQASRVEVYRPLFKLLYKPAFDLANGLVGRTGDNAAVYDLIKRVRAMAQQLRQQFREKVPEVIAARFSRALTRAEWASLHRGLGKTDLAALVGAMPRADLLAVLKTASVRQAKINELEVQLQQVAPAVAAIYSRKAKQLAVFMVTGIAGGNLLRNAEAVAHLLDVPKPAGWRAPDAATVAMIDQLTSLYAVAALPKSDRAVLASLAQGEAAGIGYAVDYLAAQRRDEMTKATRGLARWNHYKGHLPFEPQKGLSLMVADDARIRELRQQGYVRVADYRGSRLDPWAGSKGYYFAPFSGLAAFSQGIMQNVKSTAYGVDLATGYSSGPLAGRIVDRNRVQGLARHMNAERPAPGNLLPVRDADGTVVAFERSVDPAQLARLNPVEHLGEVLGVWRGRQAEEDMALASNQTLIDRLKAMHDRDLSLSPTNQAKYVDLLAGGHDPVVAEAVRLFSPDTLAYARERFGDAFWVRKDLLTDVVGYRMASIRDLFDDAKTPLGNQARDNLKRALVGMFGPDVYRRLVQGEQIVQSTMSHLRTNIVVRSVMVPAFNMASNMLQLAMRGVPWTAIGKGTLTKLAEIDSYAKSKLELIELEADLRAAGPASLERTRLEARIQAIQDAHKRLAIWPLIEAGEFSTVTDVGLTHEDLNITAGDVAGYIRKQLDKLPPGLKTAVRYGLVAHDTALFAGLQRAAQYGDFIAKAILYEDLTKRRKVPKADALAQISEEFVNYDRLPARGRSYLESMGMLWFYNYKIRITKVALAMLRENPLQALLGALVPLPSGVGTVLNDNLFVKGVHGTLPYSVGPGMALRGLHMNPWVNLVS